jgi:NADH:ubiquinone oxidoreductase subunit 4 (subunit M)
MRADVADCSQIFYTLSSLYIIFLMTSVYARTREREKAWKFGLYCLAGSVIVAPFWYLVFQKWVIGTNAFLKVAEPVPRLRAKTNISPDVMGILRDP